MKVRYLSFIILLSLIFSFSAAAAQDTTALPLTQAHCLTDEIFDREIMFGYPETWVAGTLTTQFGDVDFLTSTERSASAFQASEGSLQADMFESGEVVMIFNYIDTDSLESITGAEVTDAASALDADLSFNGVATSSEIETIQIGDRTVARAGYAPTPQYEGAVYGMIVDNLFILVRAFARVGDYPSQEASVQAVIGSVNTVCDESAFNFEPETIQPVLPVAYGETVTGEMVDSETATYTFAGNAGDSLIITMSSEDFDPILALRSSTGQLLIESTNFSGGDAILEFTLTADGTYTIVPSAFFEQQNGEYQISVAENPGGLTRTGDPAVRVMAYDQPAENELMVDGADVDYQFYAQEGDLITITLDAVGFQPFFRLIEGGGFGMADTYGVTDSHLQLQYLIREEAYYYIRVTGVDGFPNPSNGTYTLSVTAESNVQPTLTPGVAAENTAQPTPTPDVNVAQDSAALPLTETYCFTDEIFGIGGDILLSYPSSWAFDDQLFAGSGLYWLASSAEALAAFEASEAWIPNLQLPPDDVILEIHYTDESFFRPDLTDLESRLAWNLDAYGIPAESETESTQIGDQTVARVRVSPDPQFEGEYFAVQTGNVVVMVMAFASVGEYEPHVPTIEAILGSFASSCDGSGEIDGDVSLNTHTTPIFTLQYPADWTAENRGEDSVRLFKSGIGVRIEVEVGTAHIVELYQIQGDLTGASNPREFLEIFLDTFAASADPGSLKPQIEEIALGDKPAAVLQLFNRFLIILQDSNEFVLVNLILDDQSINIADYTNVALAIAETIDVTASDSNSVAVTNTPVPPVETAANVESPLPNIDLAICQNGLTVLADIEGQINRTITREVPLCFRPIWSPDGTMIAQGEEIYRLDGTQVLRIPIEHIITLRNARMPITWSPNSDQIAFKAARDSGIYVSPVSSYVPRYLSPPDNRFAMLQPTWSPNSDRLLILYTEPASIDGTDLAFINPDGTGLQLIYNTPGVSEGPAAWSHTGNHIAFWEAPTNLHSDVGARIKIITPDGTLITTSSEAFSSGVLESPVWSPDDTKVAFVAFSATEPHFFAHYVMDVATGEVTMLTTNVYHNNTLLSWSPDGTTLGYNSDSGTAHLINADGTNERVYPLSSVGDLSFAPFSIPGDGSVALVNTSAATATPVPTLVPTTEIDAPAVIGDGTLELTETFSPPDTGVSISYPQGWFTSYQIAESGSGVYITNYPGEPRKVMGWGEGEYFIECSRDFRQDYTHANLNAVLADYYVSLTGTHFEKNIVEGVEWLIGRNESLSLDNRPQSVLAIARVAGGDLLFCQAITYTPDMEAFAPTALAIMTSFRTLSEGGVIESAVLPTSTTLPQPTEVALAEASPISYDQPITGTTTPGTVDTYEFAGTTGQYIRVVFESPDACYTLVPPDNFQLMTDADGDPYYGLRLPLDGAYQVLVQSISGAAADYTFTVVHDLGIEYGNQAILAVGGAAEIFTQDEGLKLRSGAGTDFDIIETMPPGTTVEIIGGPTSNQGLVWWNVRAPSGNEGWAVEGADNIQTLIPVAVTLSPFESGEPFASLCSVALGDNAVSGANTVASNPTIAPPPATPISAPTLIPPVTCPGTLTSRLIVGQSGRVILEGGSTANRVRSQPTTSTGQVGEIPPGGEFAVLEGPECADGYAWWRVDYEGLIGWTAEGDDLRYWLEPVEETGAASDVQVCVAVTDGNVNLRLGPGTNFDVAGEVGGGLEYTVTGQAINQSGFTWYRFENDLWARQDVIQLQGDCTNIPMVS